MNGWSKDDMIFDAMVKVAAVSAFYKEMDLLEPEEDCVVI